jgi:hypothetical protein
LAVVGLAIGAASVQAVGGDLRAGRVGSNLEYLAAHRGTFDTVFIGSSRVGRNVIPKTFDDRMREHGLPTRSFNLWFGTMTAPEARQVVRELVRHEPRPKLLIVESLPADGGIPDDHRRTDRAVWWRTLEELPYLAGDIVAAENYALAAEHAKTTFARWFRVGNGPEIARRFTEAQAELVPIIGAGYEPMVERGGSTPRSFRDHVHNLSAREPSEARASHLRFHRQILEIVDNRAQVVFLLPAGSTLIAVNLAGEPNTIVTNDPVAYQELYAFENWCDPKHLDMEGARLHTELIADLFAASPAAMHSARESLADAPDPAGPLPRRPSHAVQ